MVRLPGVLVRVCRSSWLCGGDHLVLNAFSMHWTDCALRIAKGIGLSCGVTALHQVEALRRPLRGERKCPDPLR